VLKLVEKAGTACRGRLVAHQLVRIESSFNENKPKKRFTRKGFETGNGRLTLGLKRFAVRGFGCVVMV